MSWCPCLYTFRRATRPRISRRTRTCTRRGRGVHADKNGTFTGDWERDKEHGKGRWTGIGRPDHEKDYDGDWKAGGRDGYGALLLQQLLIRAHAFVP